MSHRSLAALVLVGCLGLAACGGVDTSAQPEPTGPPVSSAPAATQGPDEPAATPAPSVTPDDAQVVAVTVAGGEVSGDTGRVEVPLGTVVRLTVTSDVVDEIHVHGFELFQEVSAGQAGQLEFIADRAGIFEVELERSRTVLTRLQIS